MKMTKQPSRGFIRPNTLIFSEIIQHKQNLCLFLALFDFHFHPFI